MASRTIAPNRVYRGVNITHDPYAIGYRLPWCAYLNGRFVYADTLAGIKELIRGELV